MYISGRKIIWYSQRFGTSNTGGTGSYYSTVQPYSRTRTAKTAKDLEDPQRTGIRPSDTAQREGQATVIY